MSLPGRVWIISGIVLVIVLAGFLTLPQAPATNAAQHQLDCASSDCHSIRVREMQVHDILGPGIEACFACHGSNPGGGADPPEGGPGGHYNDLMLRLADGTLLRLKDSPQLCGQCHQGFYDAWEERAPLIPGTANIAKCTDCHSPHGLQIPILDIAEPHPLAAPPPTLTPPSPYAGLENLFSWDDASAQEAGKVIFQESCAVCHVAKEAVPALGVDFYAVDYRQILEERPDLYFWIVSEGLLDKAMLPFVASLSEEGRWQVLTYIWSLEGTVPTVTLTIAVDGSGSTTPAVGEHEYTVGEVVTITATAISGWEFENWTGDVADPNSAVTTVTMDASETVTANFFEAPMIATLTIAVSGSGSTTPAVGPHEYFAGEAVTITATAASGWQFDNWTGNVANRNSATTTVTIDANKTVTANFSEIPAAPVTLTMAVNGNGLTTPAVGAHDYPAGTMVQITATAASGWQFDNWTGTVANPNSATTTVNMNDNETVTANFSETPAATVTLTIAVDGSGSTTPAVGEYEYTVGEVVTITATAISGWEFENWTGDVADPNSAVTTVTMDGSLTVTANFFEAPMIATLTIAVSGNGSTTPAVGPHEYFSGEAVTITATAASGWQFDNWTGNVANRNSATTTVTVDGNGTVTANFSETTATTPPNPDDETPLNMWLIVGAVLGVLVVGGVVYYFVRRGG